MNLNKAFILGNVTRDPEVRSLPSGQQVASFGIATNRFYTDQSGQKKQDVEFHNIVTFGKLADIASRYLTKGALVFIEGRLKTSNWLNSAGAKQYKTEIIAETLQLGPKGAGGSPRNNNESTSNQPTKAEDIPIIEENYNPISNSEPKDSGEIDVKDIPF